MKENFRGYIYKAVEKLIGPKETEESIWLPKKEQYLGTAGVFFKDDDRIKAYKVIRWGKPLTVTNMEGRACYHLDGERLIRLKDADIPIYGCKEGGELVQTDLDKILEVLHKQYRMVVLGEEK